MVLGLIGPQDNLPGRMIEDTVTALNVAIIEVRIVYASN